MVSALNSQPRDWVLNPKPDGNNLGLSPFMQKPQSTRLEY